MPGRIRSWARLLQQMDSKVVEQMLWEQKFVSDGLVSTNNNRDVCSLDDSSRCRIRVVMEVIAIMGGWKCRFSSCAYMYRILLLLLLSDPLFPACVV